MIQLQVLNYILDTKDINFLSYNNIDLSFFSDYKNEFKYIFDHISTYNKVPDKESFLSQFPNFDIIKVNENSDYLINELYKDKNTRTLAKTFNSIRDLLNQGKIEDAMSLFSSSSQSISKEIKMNAIDILHDTSRYDAFIERSNDFSKYYLKTGFKELDELIGGWDRQEELATIVARPRRWQILAVT